MAQDGPGFAVLVVFAQSGAEDGGADTGTDATTHGDRRGAGKVGEAKITEPAAAPDPVAGDGIDEGRNAEGIDTVGEEFCSLRHGAGDDGGGCGAENGLEDQIGEQGHALRQDGGVVPLDHRVQAADQGPAAGEHQAEAQQPVDRRADAEVHEIFHEDVACVLGPGEAGLAHGEARLHQKDQRRAYQDPDGVD